ncbi:glucosamine-6-phosphate deaminase [Parelusimicrobium proximum]|uniref:glucosamine-6-phosphate deaminase n=1 Tax=Parelusimicrobium proximum TaxID=3228953 RepID=UPI003D183B65
MRLIVTKKDPGLWTAELVKKRIKDAKNKKFVLALPTGGTAESMYAYIAEKYNKGEIDFTNVITFNLDEYVGIDADNPQSYHSYMQKHLYSHIKIPAENIHILNGTALNLDKECADYEDKITKAGGFDLFLGGVGVNGHIAFNEPFSTKTSRTREVPLTENTIEANARFFDSIDDVPKSALTMGIATILESKEIVIMAKGTNKAEALRYAIEEEENAKWVISCFRSHPKTVIVADEDAASKLSEKTLSAQAAIKDEYSEINDSI